MTDQEAFDIIDSAIDLFKSKDGCQKRIKVDKRPKSDWLVFKWRQLSWTSNSLNYLIEIFPQFDEIDKIESWSLYTAVSYDDKTSRYYLKKDFAERTSIEFIADNCYDLLVQSFKFISAVEKADIPFSVHLSKI